MRVGDALRLALEIAEAALDLVDSKCGSSRRANELRLQTLRLRAVV